MEGLSKILTVAGLAGAGFFVYQKYKGFMDFKDSLRVYITGLSLKIKGGQVVVPFQVNMDNPTEVAIPVQDIFITIYKKEPTGEWAYIANSNPQVKNFTIKAHDTTVLSHSVRMPALNALKEAFSLLDQQKELKVNVKIKAFGQVVAFDSIHTV